MALLGIACGMALAAAADELAPTDALDPSPETIAALTGTPVAGENQCSELGSAWDRTPDLNPVTSDAPARGPASEELLGSASADPALSLPGGGALEMQAGEGSIGVAGSALPELELWRGGGRWAVGLDPSTVAHLGIGVVGSEPIVADHLTDMALSMHAGPASANLLLLRSGWAAGEPFWLAADPERLDLATDTGAISLPGDALEVRGGGTLKFTPEGDATEVGGSLGLSPGTGWTGALAPSADVTLQARDAPGARRTTRLQAGAGIAPDLRAGGGWMQGLEPKLGLGFEARDTTGAELTAQLRASAEITPELRAGTRFNLALECFDRDLLGPGAEGRGFMLRFRL